MATQVEMMESENGRASGGGAKRAIKLALVVVLVASFVASIALLPVQDLLSQLLTWVQSLGLVGGLVFVLAYIVATVFFIPGSLLTLGAGFVYGLGWGTVIVSVGSTIGAAVSFLLGRFVAREAVAAKLEDYPKFAAVDRAIEHDGLKTVLLVRLSPLFPFNLLNYSFGLTKVSFGQYVFGSWLGMLPGTIMYVYFGSAAESLASIVAGNVQGGSERYILLALGLVATIVVTVLISRKAKREFEALSHEG